MISVWRDWSAFAMSMSKKPPKTSIGTKIAKTMNRRMLPPLGVLPVVDTMSVALVAAASTIQLMDSISL
ncbi:MAG: hypothetical protein K8F62_15285 [Pseudorhodoplanes sp.]|nr:hypothetical protein [Pseudorhodoplanes sp.]